MAAAVRYFESNLGWSPAEIASRRLRAWNLPDEAFEPDFKDFKPF
ncbi:MAG TPA: hypothetical protein VNE62_01085 [Actinomycetota bacterium]|nr:hypothetical protein [Actinomycetota bacterium]